MLVHCVYFWLKPGTSEADREAFRAGLESLSGIGAAEAVYVGTPAATPTRPVIDASYDFALTVLVKDVPAHDAYQDDPIHHAFLEQHRHRWAKVLIYDAA